MFKQKFKVWDVEKQEWSEERFALLQDGNLVNLGNLEVKYRETHIPSFFTGFKASGVEIYTGDILQYRYIDVPLEVKSCRSVLAYELDEAKIIGNIYKDKELIYG